MMKPKLAATTKVATEPKSKALFNSATLTVRQAAGSDTQSWDYVMAELIVLPSTLGTRHKRCVRGTWL